MQEDLPTQSADATVTIGSPPRGNPGDHSRSLLPDRQFGSARLIRRIGIGGMGEVWLARHQLLGRDVAIKFLLASTLNSDDPAFQTFIQGAKTAASVEHPALNRIHHADVVDGVPFLVLEFLDGENLADLIARTGPLPPAVVRAILEPVCDAVGELHYRDLIHRDNKPSNIMLTVEGRAVLTDFGLSRGGPASALRSNTGGVAGTPAYMAPEMFDGIVSARTDVYALGMTAYHLLSGRPAFTGSLAELQSQHRTVPVNTQPLRSAGVSEGIIDVISRATSRDVLFRPKTARHLLENFRSAFNAAGIQPAPRPALIPLVISRSGQTADASTGKTASGDPPKTLAEFAAKKRELREAGPRKTAIPAEPVRMATAGEKRQSRIQQIRYSLAFLLAWLCGGMCVDLVRRADNFIQSVTRWAMIHIVHVKGLTTATGEHLPRKCPVAVNGDQ